MDRRGCTDIETPESDSVVAIETGAADAKRGAIRTRVSESAADVALVH